MGQGFSTELGEDSLGERVRDSLSEVLQWLRSNDPGLQEIEAPNVGIGDDGLEQAARALAANEHIRTIDISYNQITSFGCVALSNQLKSSPCAKNTLVQLRLSGNKIGAQGCEKLCEWLTMNPPLQELYLFNCGLDDQCVYFLANALQKNTALVTLNIAGNDGITNRSVIMLAKALENNHTLAHLDLPSPKNVIFSAQHMDAVLSVVRQNAIALDHRRKAEAMREQKRIEKELLAAQKRKERDAQLALEKEKVQEEISALESMKLKEEAEIRRLEQEMEAKMRSKNAAAESKRSLREAELAKRQQECEQWKMKLTANGTITKEWRHGFTILKMAPGQIGGVPTITNEAPRRLKPCWCDPQDAAAPYAKTLHYHCKHEKVDTKVDDGAAAGAPHYDGCKRTGHVCATVGFYTKPLPDLSPAFFFASPHPSAVAAAQEDSAAQ